MSKAKQLTHAERAALLEHFDSYPRIRAERCEYGHPECAVTRRGACVMEVIELVSDERGSV